MTDPMTTDRNSEVAVIGWTECTRNCDCVGYCKAGLEKPIYGSASGGDGDTRSSGSTPQAQGMQRGSTPPAPASIPAAEVQALVERLRVQSEQDRAYALTLDDPVPRNWRQGRAEGYEAAADNLALLIPRNPE